jgi:hypothetical protein
MHYLVNTFLFFFIYYLIWFLGNNGEPITHDTWVLLLLKYDDQETQTVWKTRTDTQPKTNYGVKSELDSTSQSYKISQYVKKAASSNCLN